MAAERPGQRSCDCKIGRDIDRYQLDELNEQVIHNRQDNELSLRDLATFINHRVLEAAIEDASGDILEDESDLFGALDQKDAIAAIYGALQDEDVSPDRRARVRTRLSQAGVDLDVVEDHWVTHTTVRRHLQECLDLDTSSEQTLEPENAKSTIEWIRTRCTAIVVRTFERLQSAGHLNVSDLDVSVSIRATCTECGKTYSPSKLISRGHCDCYQTPNQPE
jgi:hypothetical protein